MKQSFTKYLFVFCTFVFVLSSQGIPVYLHYCGGELEEVSYLGKANSCCGEEEGDETESDCCSNEHYVLRTQLDVVHHQAARLAELSFTDHDFFFSATPLRISNLLNAPFLNIDPSPPPLQQANLIDFTIMRI